MNAEQKRRVVTVTKISVSTALFVFLLSKAGITRTAHTLDRANLGWLGLGVLIFFAACAVTIGQWQSLLGAAGLRRTYARCLRLELAADAFDAALPTAIGGDVVRAALAAEAPHQRIAAASSVVLRRLCNFPGLMVVMGAGCLATLNLRYAGRAHTAAVVALLAGAAGVTVCASPLLSVLARWSLLQRIKVARILAKLLDALAQFRRQPGRLVPATVRGLVYWTCVVGSAYCYMRAVGIHPSLAYAAVVVTLVNMISILPVSLGGYGVREGTFSAFLAVGGLAVTSQAVAVGLILSAQTLLLGLVGVFFYLTLPDRRRATRVDEGMVPAAAVVTTSAPPIPAHSPQGVGATVGRANGRRRIRTAQLVGTALLLAVVGATAVALTSSPSRSVTASAGPTTGTGTSVRPGVSAPRTAAPGITPAPTPSSTSTATSTTIAPPVLSIGSTTTLPATSPPVAVSGGSFRVTGNNVALTHVVVSGDTLFGISEWYRLMGGVTALYAWNHSTVGADPNVIYPGEVLTITVPQQAIPKISPVYLAETTAGAVPAAVARPTS